MIRLIPALGLMLAAAAADAASVRGTVQVDGDLVTLGDLIDDAGEAAAAAVFRSPALGRSGTISASRVVEAAARYGLDVDAQIATVTVHRNSRPITREIVEATVRAELAGRGLTGPDIEAEITVVGLAEPLHLPPSILAEPTIARLDIEADTGEFSVTVTVEDDRGGTAATLRARGRLTEFTEVAVLANRVDRFGVIGPDDVEMKRIRKRDMRGDALPFAAIVGQAAVRRLPPGTQIKSDDLRAPVLVRKNDTVTMLLKTGRLTLSTEGRALANGAAGDTVPLLNTRSHVRVEGRVVAGGLVEIDLSPAAIAIATAPETSTSQ